MSEIYGLILIYVIAPVSVIGFLALVLWPFF